jgi:hypothetical protein
MARIARLAGAMIVDVGGAVFVVGQTKEPCDWRAHGFEPPPEPERTESGAVAVHVRRLTVSGEVRLREPLLQVTRNDEGLADVVARRFVVVRNGSVSERLWRLVLTPPHELDLPPAGVFAADWLVDMPDPVWEVVRDTVLKCS